MNCYLQLILRQSSTFEEDGDEIDSRNLMVRFRKLTRSLKVLNLMKAPTKISFLRKNQAELKSRQTKASKHWETINRYQTFR